MTRWEYHVTYSHGRDKWLRPDDLNHFGSDGWELVAVSVAPVAPSGPGPIWVYTFKRAIGDTPAGKGEAQAQ